MSTLSIPTLHHHPVERSSTGPFMPNILQELDLSRKATIVGPNAIFDLGQKVQI